MQTLNIETIAAISTAQAAAGIAVIRISGPCAIEVANRVFKANSGATLDSLPGYTAKHGRVYMFCPKSTDPPNILDEAIALVFRAPHSYTGEDTVEISCHGGVYITRQILHSILQAGARPAQPGEFTKRAYLNGKLDLTQAEATMSLINAQGKSALKCALAAQEGALFHEISYIKAGLLDLAASLAVYIDYPDEDMQMLSVQKISLALEKARENLDDLISGYGLGKIIREGINTAIIGSPNVGKSTLMNLLVGCERSIVTSIEGTTRDTVEETITLGDFSLNLIDTAGIRDTNDEVEQIGVKHSKKALERADLVLVVFDGSRALSQNDFNILGLLENTPAIAIINKSDLPPVINRKDICQFIQHVVDFSSLRGKGLEELKKAVSQVVNFAKISPNDACLANERQLFAAKEAFNCICAAITGVNVGITIDAVSGDIQDAINHLCNITGERATETIISEIFSRFCVGK